MSDAVRCPATISTTATLLNLRKKYKKRVTQFQDIQNNYFFSSKATHSLKDCGVFSKVFSNQRFFWGKKHTQNYL